MFNNHKELMKTLLEGKTIVNKNTMIKLDKFDNIIISINGIWHPISPSLQTFSFSSDWEILEENIQIGNFLVPKPVSSIDMNIGEVYYFVDFQYDNNLVDYRTFSDNKYDHQRFKMNICHKSENSAKIHADALIKISSQYPKTS
jgi:hypothetical protein